MGGDASIFITAANHNTGGLIRTEQVEDGIASRDVGQKVIAQTSSLGGPLDQTGDIDNVQVSGDLTGRLVVIDQVVEAVVRNRDTALIRVDRAEREILGRCTGFGQHIEEGGPGGRVSGY